MSAKEKYIGESKVKDEPKKKLSFKIADGAVTTDKLHDGAVTKDKIAEESVGLPELSSDVHQALASVHEGGIAVTNDFGDSEYIGISQKTITEMKDVLNNDIADINTVIGEDEAGGTIKGRIGALEQSDNTINQRIIEESNRAQAAETAIINGYEGQVRSTVVVGTLPQSGVANTIYRVPGESNYKDYAWDGNNFVELAQYDNVLDDVPTKNSNNIPKSGGVWNAFIPYMIEKAYRQGENLLDLPITTYQTNKYFTLNANDEVVIASNSNTKITTNYIDVTDIKRLSYKSHRYSNTPVVNIVAYDENKQIIRDNCISITSSNSGVTTGIWTKGENTKYIRMTCSDASSVGASYIKNPDVGKIELDETPTEGHTDIPVSSHGVANALSEVAGNILEISDDVDTISSTISGGEETIESNGKELVSSTGHYMYTINGSVKRAATTTWSEWRIKNKDYSKISAYVGLNAELPKGDGIPFICFIVGPDFVFDPSKGYTYAKHGETVEIDGTEYIIDNSGSYDYVYYEEDVARAKNITKTIIDREIPEGTITIIVCTRNTALGSNSYIKLYSNIVREGIAEKLNNIDEKLENIEEEINKETEVKEDNFVNYDQDCLLLRNYIKTNWPYYFNPIDGATGYDTQGYLDKKIKDIPKGKHFIFITDTHWQDSPAKPKSTYIASYVSKRLGGCTTVFGGDCINSASDKYLAAKAFSVYADEFYSAFGDNGLWVQGNHDSNRLGIGDGVTAVDALIDDIEIYKRSIMRLEHKVKFDTASLESIQNIGLTAEEKANAEAWIKMHYHWDDHKNKIRYIVYETGCGGVTMYNLVRSGTSYMLPLEYNWVSRTLLSTPKDYDIVILGHMFGAKYSSYTAYSSGNTDSRVIMKLFRAFKTKGSITINMRTVNTTEGTAFTRALCGTVANKTFNFIDSVHEGRMFIVSGHWHNDARYMCRYYTNIDGVEGQNGVNVQSYNEVDVTTDTVIQINVACDTAAAGRNNSYSERSSADVGTVKEILFDVFTITDDDYVVCTRFGYGNDRTINLTGASGSDEDDQGGGEGGDDDNPDEIINS